MSTLERDTNGSQKRIKITASNGSDILRETSGGQLELGTSSSSRPKRVIVKGRLTVLLSLPLDVLFEIFGHLLPQDILYLSRLTKEFRRLLLAKSAKPIWKDAFANIPDFPACPPEMTLPAWADLAFGSHCQNCFSAKTRQVDFILRVRLCAACAKTCLIPVKQFETGRNMDKIILRCVPFTNKFPSRSGIFCTVKSKDALIQQVHDQQYEDINAFVRKRKAERKVREEHGRKCKAWFDRLAKTKAVELDNIRLERKEAITKKLIDMGFQSEIEYLKQLENSKRNGESRVTFLLLGDHPDVKVSKPLTERADDRRKIKESRKDLAIHEWYSYRQKHLEDTFMPSPVDVLKWEEAESIINLHRDVNVSPEMFRNLFSGNLERFIRTWRKKQVVELAYKSFHNLYWPYPSWDSRMQLAICVFRCRGEVHELESDYISNPDPLMWYPEFLHHPCNSISIKYFYEEKEDPYIYRNVNLAVNRYAEPCRRKEWSSELLLFDGKASRIVRSILKGCDLDPGNTTVAMLDQLDPRVVCLKCSFGAKADGERSFTVRSWRNAVKHCIKSHFGDSQVAWQKVKDIDASQSRVLEASERIRRGLGPEPEKIWRCIKCIDLPDDPGAMTLGSMRSHCIREHDKVDGGFVQGEDYYRALECPPKQPLAVRIIPQEVTDASKE